jgi:peptide/nickel transport system permease protein
MNLLRWLTGRVLYSLAVVLGVVSLIFFLFNILPGDPARMMLGQRADMNSVESITKELGLDKPIHFQYFRYLNDLSPLSIFRTNNAGSYFYLDSQKYKHTICIFKTGNGISMVIKAPWLGKSFQSQKAVSEIISEAFPNTLILALTSILLAFVFGNIFGIFAAIRQNSWYDRSALFFTAIGMSLPSFFAAILIAWFFAYKLGNITHLNITGNLYTVDNLGKGIHLELKNLILPSFTLGIRPLSVVIQLSRNSMLEVLSQDYIRTAFAKGLSFRRVIFVHAFRNSLTPVVTAVSGWFASMLAGVVFVEYIFGWKGLGYLLVNALNFYDLPVVLGCVLTTAILFVIVNISMDLIYAVLDPRIRK